MFLEKIIGKKDLFKRFVETFGGMSVEEFENLNQIPKNFNEEELILISSRVNEAKKTLIEANQLNTKYSLSQLFLISFILENNQS